jgi:hypothetical protein
MFGPVVWEKVQDHRSGKENYNNKAGHHPSLRQYAIGGSAVWYR